MAASCCAAAARHGLLGARLLAQLQKAARDRAAATEKGPEPRGRALRRGAARSRATPCRSGGRAAPAPLSGGGQRWRPERAGQEPLRPPGQPAAGRGGTSRRAAPGTEPGEWGPAGEGCLGAGGAPRRARVAAFGQQPSWGSLEPFRALRTAVFDAQGPRSSTSDSAAGCRSCCGGSPARAGGACLLGQLTARFRLSPQVLQESGTRCRRRRSPTERRWPTPSR